MYNFKVKKIYSQRIELTEDSVKQFNADNGTDYDVVKIQFNDNWSRATVNGIVVNLRGRRSLNTKMRELASEVKKAIDAYFPSHKTEEEETKENENLFEDPLDDTPYICEDEEIYEMSEESFTNYLKGLHEYYKEGKH